MDLFKKYADFLLLSFFLQNPTGQFYVRELAEKLGLSPSKVSVASRALELQGILKSEERGLAKFYRLNNDAPLVKAFKVVHSLAKLSEAKLVEKLLERDPSIISIAVYGSYASGTNDEKSAIKLLVISQKEKEVFLEVLRSIEERHGIRLDLEVLKLGEWRDRVKKSDSLYREVLSAHILLFGSNLI